MFFIFFVDFFPVIFYSEKHKKNELQKNKKGKKFPDFLLFSLKFFLTKNQRENQWKKNKGEKQNKKQKMSESEKHKKFGGENKGKKGKMNNTFFGEEHQ